RAASILATALIGHEARSPAQHFFCPPLSWAQRIRCAAGSSDFLPWPRRHNECRWGSRPTRNFSDAIQDRMNGGGSYIRHFPCSAHFCSD
ncbi:unnamed protein product, partial [Amoebophrya sp. A120]